MDEVVDGVLIGPQVNATLINSPALVAGKVGNAMFFDGTRQYADFGLLDHPCLRNPEDCINGMSFSYWAKVSNTADGKFLGYGCNVQTVGTCAARLPGGSITFVTKTTTEFFLLTVQPEVFTTDIWWLILQTWTEQYGTIVYLNGVRSGDHEKVALSPKYDSIGTTFRMGRGHNPSRTYEGGRATIDEFLFWPEARGEDFAKFLYDMY